jgi:hypothetical protein
LANTAIHVLQQIEECEWSANSTTTSKVIPREKYLLDCRENSTITLRNLVITSS